MNMQEYDWYAHGFLIRQSKMPEGLRNIWLILHNVHAKRAIQNMKQLSEVWPIYTDNMGGKADEDADNRIAIFRELRAKRDQENAKLRFRSNNKQ